MTSTRAKGGILPALSRYLEEEETEEEHTLTAVLSNLPFIHRAYRYTFRSHPELFIPLRGVVYRKGSDDYVWITAKIEGRFADGRSLSTLPDQFEIDKGYTNECVIRTSRRVKWYGRRASKEEKDRATDRLATYHRKLRQHLVYISASPDLWYVKRQMAGAVYLRRYSLTLIMAAMHRLSELSRYDPEGLMTYLDGKENWLLTEFIELAPMQFIDELVCEMTSLEFGIPGIRPRSNRQCKRAPLQQCNAGAAKHRCDAVHTTVEAQRGPHRWIHPEPICESCRAYRRGRDVPPAAEGDLSRSARPGLNAARKADS
jgi:hypothetical protein